MFKRRIDGGEWEELTVEDEDGNTVCFMMDDQNIDYVSFDTEEGKVEYQRTNDLSQEI